MNNKQKIYIGTSGWHYGHWKGVFYPPEIKKEEWLPFYAERFDTAEVNNTFYNLPSPETFAHWRDSTPSSFLFSIKASRYITHLKKLKNCQEAVQKFLEGTKELGEKRKVILFQLPPNLKPSKERLEDFLKETEGIKGVRYVFEFRDPQWYAEEIMEVLRRYKVGLCLHDMGEGPPPVATSKTVYIRFHGPAGDYTGSYNEEDLEMWGERIRTWTKEGTEIFVYFNNDAEGNAPQNAQTLRDILGLEP